MDIRRGDQLGDDGASARGALAQASCLCLGLKRHFDQSQYFLQDSLGQFRAALY